MKRLLAGLLITIMLFVVCSCGETNAAVNNNSSKTETENTESYDSKPSSEVLPPSETMESISQRATNIMFAYCYQVRQAEKGKAVFDFAVIKEYKATDKFEFDKVNLIRVVGDIDKYDYQYTYAENNCYVLWLTYNEVEDVYTDIGIRILPLMERKPNTLVDEFEQFRQEIINLNNGRGGQIYKWMCDID